MTEDIILSIIESPGHPRLSSLYKELGFREIQVTSMRKAMAAVKNYKPAFIVAEFFYGYGNNYAGVNVSNLDVLLSSLVKFSPDTKTIVFVQKDEMEYVEKLHKLYPLHAAFLHNTPEHVIADALK
ncbi:MAG: hypothetical protein OEZ38_01050 [Gammaproteobacteria bacterium]|nr:hypothetical protein [Gammaproteobacteria bacterium]